MSFFQTENTKGADKRWRRDRAAPRVTRLVGEKLEDRALLAISAEMVLDINPGAGSSWSDQIVEYKGLAYLWANDGNSGRELWTTDGTAAGTKLFKDINPGPAGSDPWNFTIVNGTLFFEANDGVHGFELWKTDGTASGTVMVKDINPSSTNTIGTGAGPLTNVNGTLFFGANDGVHGSELWKSDGTSSGTVLVKDINPGPANSQWGRLTNVNGTAYFAANDGANGVELWKSDGTTSGTSLVADLAAGSSSSEPLNITNVNGTVFFSANDGKSGNALWKSNGTSAGTVEVKPFSAGPGNLYNHNGTLFFSANDALWKSDGTTQGTVYLSGPGGASFLTSGNGALFFGQAEKLKKTDGTPAGTVAVSDASGLWQLVNVNGRLYFWANTPATGGEPWTSDGTPAGTVLVRDINPGSNGSGPRGEFNFVELNGNLLFAANDGVHGDELWIVPANNTPPVAQDKIVTTAKNAARAIALVATDLESSTLTYTIISQPQHGTLSGAAPNLIYTPANDYTGPDSFTFQASDGEAASNIATVSITIVVNNQAPVANDKLISLPEDSGIAIALSASDSESAVLAYSVVDSPLHGRLNGTAPNLTYEPDGNYHGSDRFTFRASDGTLDSNLAVVLITVTPVNDPPIAEGGVLLVRLNDGRKQIVFEDTDIDGDPLTRSIVSQPQHGRIIQEGGLFYYEPPAAPQLLDEFTYQVSDGQSLSNISNFIIVNFDLIVFAEDGEQTKEEWAQKLFPSVPPGTSFLTTNDNNALFSEQPEIDSAGTLTFTPAPNSYGTATVTVVKQTGAEGEDDGGGEGGLGDVATFTIEVVQQKPWQNDINPYDVDNDECQCVVPGDALLIINYINGTDDLEVPLEGWPGPFYDVTGDNWVAPEDVLAVINVINLGTVVDGEPPEAAIADCGLQIAELAEREPAAEAIADCDQNPIPDSRLPTPWITEDMLELLAWDLAANVKRRKG